MCIRYVHISWVSRLLWAGGGHRNVRIRLSVRHTADGRCNRYSSVFEFVLGVGKWVPLGRGLFAQDCSIVRRKEHYPFIN